MLWNIFSYEVRYWVKQPSTYIFGCIFFAFGLAAMAISGDILGEMNVIEGSKPFANSSFNIISYFFDLNLFILFVIPVFIGGSVYRDYSSNFFMVLYSYPIRKADYFLGKFLSGLFITSLILSLIGLGLFIGSTLPGLNPLLIGPNSILLYFQPYFLIVFPNLVFISMIVFSVVLLSRNSYTGFITILLLYILRRILLFVLGGPDNQFLITLIDPFGQVALYQVIQGWAIQEINNSIVPGNQALVVNRVIWIGISFTLFAVAYQKFSFTQAIQSFNFLRRKKKSSTTYIEANKFYATGRTVITPVSSEYSLFSQLLSTWRISKYEFKSIVLSKAFAALLLGSFLFMFLLLGQVNPQYTTRIQPLTQVMLLVPALFYSFVIILITFLYAGILIHRDRRSRMNQLVDVCAFPNWSLIGSKFLTLLKLQIVLLSVIMIVGIIIQAWRGSFQFEISLYLFHIYGVLFITLAIWAMIALFVQTIVPNQYIGFFLLIMFSIGIGGLENIGVKLDIFKFNAAPLAEYSDLSGFGGSLPAYYVHKLYWALFGSLLLVGTYLFWLRGLSQSLWERLRIAQKRLTRSIIISFLLILFGFIGTGSFIYTKVYPEKPLLTVNDLDLYKAEAEKKFSPFRNTPQPRLSAIKMKMNLFPKERNYTSSGELFFVNKSKRNIDTLLVNYPAKINIVYSFARKKALINSDSVLRFDIYSLNEPLLPNDTLVLAFEAYNTSSTIFKSNSQVSTNGTFLLADFPLLGYPGFELSNENKRNSYGLPPQHNTAIHPNDPNADENSYVGKNIDLMDFEAIVSTSTDQIALAPGELINQWIKEDRAYFHYRSGTKIRNGIVFNSGQFEVFKDSLDGVSLEIFHHKSHDFNLDRMMQSMKATLQYSSDNFGPYQFKQMRIIEFPKPYGNFAQSFANTIPFSEFAGFISRQDSSENRFDDVLRLTAHEMAHQWWGHQVIPAEALGNRMLSESLAEYTALQVLEQEQGVDKKTLYLEIIRKRYLEERNRSMNESPLQVVSPNEAHIHYAKGLLAFEALDKYLGKEQFNTAIRNFLREYGLQDASYPTSLDLVDHFKKVAPDSLQYLIVDLFEKVTLYENSIVDASFAETGNDTFEIEIEFNISKFRNPEAREKIFSENEIRLEFNSEKNETIRSLPLKDYIEIGIFGDSGLIHSKKYLVSSINNSITIQVKQKPVKIVLDPFNMLIESNTANNEVLF